MVDTPIPSATASTYTLVSGDLGATVYCRVTATNASGSTNAISNVVGPITGSVPPANAGGVNLPNIADTTPEVTIAVTCTTGTWTGDPTILYSYQWKSGGANVGTDSASYTPVVGDLGATLSCVVTATNGAGSASATSNTTGAVAAAPAGGSTWSTTDLYETAGQQIDFSGGNLIATGRSISTTDALIGMRGQLGHNSGKKYFEITTTSLPNTDGMVGVVASSFTLAGTPDILPGISNNLGFGFRHYASSFIDAVVYNTNTGFYSVTSFTVAANDVYGFALDMDTRTAWFRRNGTWLAGDPVAGTGGLAWGATPTTMFPFFIVQPTIDPDGSSTINTGGSAFAHTIPSGFTAWG